MGLVIMLPLLGLMFFMMNAQKKRARAQQALLAALAPGDRVLTIGGIYGTIAALDDDLALLTVAPGVDLQVARGAISRRIEPDDAVSGTSDGSTGSTTTDSEDRP